MVSQANAITTSEYLIEMKECLSEGVASQRSSEFYVFTSFLFISFLSVKSDNFELVPYKEQKKKPSILISALMPA